MLVTIVPPMVSCVSLKVRWLVAERCCYMAEAGSLTTRAYQFLRPTEG